MASKARGVVCVLLFCALACRDAVTAQQVAFVGDAGTTVPASLRAELEALGFVVETVPETTTPKAKPVFSQKELDAMVINATKMNNVEEVKKYLDLGANLQLTTGIAKRSLLHIASKTGGTELIELLIEEGAEVDALTIGLATPLHVAAADNRVDAAQLLLDNGADKFAETSEGNTPLHWAATQGHPEMAKLLLDWGSDDTAINRAGDIPLDVICCCECGEDSNCTCEDRDALVALLDTTQNNTPVLETSAPELDASSSVGNETDVETDMETVIALENDSALVVEEESEAPLPL